MENISLTIGKKYKTDSGLGGTFTVLYLGLINDKHVFENVTNNDFAGVKYRVEVGNVDNWVISEA